MRQLCRDIRTHPFSAALFMVYWLAFWAAHWSLKWSSGIPPAGVILGLLGPAIAGGMVGWWRAPTREGLLVGRHLAGGPLAAVLVMLGDMVLLFAPDSFRALQHGIREWVGIVVAWLAASAIMGLFAMGLGWVGALAGAALARVVRAGPTR